MSLVFCRGAADSGGDTLLGAATLLRIPDIRVLVVAADNRTLMVRRRRSDFGTRYNSIREGTHTMALQYRVALRNAQLDQVEVVIGTSAVLEIRSRAPPADVATADSGTVLATLTLPSDWMAAASAGSKAKSGTWQDTSADATGTAGHFRLYASDGTTAHAQGTVTATGGGGDMTVDNVSFASGQSFQVNTFTITAGNA